MISPDAKTISRIQNDRPQSKPLAQTQAPFSPVSEASCYLELADDQEYVDKMVALERVLTTLLSEKRREKAKGNEHYKKWKQTRHSSLVELVDVINALKKQQ